MNPYQVAAIFRRNMTALVQNAAARRQAMSGDPATGQPSKPAPKRAA